MKYRNLSKNRCGNSLWKRMLAFSLCAVLLCSGSGGLLEVLAETSQLAAENYSEDESAVMSEGGEVNSDISEQDDETEVISEEPDPEAESDGESEEPASEAPSEDGFADKKEEPDTEPETPDESEASQNLVPQMSSVQLDDVVLADSETEVSVENEEQLLLALGSMQTGQSKTIRLKNAITLTQSMQLTNSGTYSVTIIGEGEKTVISADDSIRLFTVKNATINLILNNVILDGHKKASGVAASDNAKLTLNGGGNSIVRNMADANGGAIRATGANIDLERMMLQNNRADKNGGAVYAYSSMINASYVTFQGNHAGESGGALYQYDTSGSILINDCTFTGNDADKYGGAIAGSNTGLTLERTTVSSNSAAFGGGIFLSTGTFRAQLYLKSSCRVEDNTAQNHGGGVYVESAVAGVFVESSSIVTRNTAVNGDGGGLYLHQAANVHLNNSTVSKNTAVNGGGVFLYDSNTLTCTNAQITENIARENGGGVFTSVISSISSATFANNQARNGGALYKANTGTKLILNMSTFDSNKATANGGAIGLDVNAWNISAGMSVFKNNEAGHAVYELTAEQQKIHDSIMMVTTGYGTVTYTGNFTHALNNYDVWNTGSSKKIEFHSNAGGDTVSNLPQDDQEYAIGADILLPVGTPVRADHTFLGWAETANASEPDYVTDPDASTKEEQNLWYTIKSGDNNLYAVWSRNEVKVTYNSNGGTFKDTSSDTVTDQVEYEGTSVAPEMKARFGYEFAGWYKTEYPEILEGGTAPGGSWDTSVPVLENTQLYACWKQVPFPIGNEEFNDPAQYEQLLREAVNSARATINIHLYDDIELTDAIRVVNAAKSGLKINFTNVVASPVSVIQKAQERHFYIRTAGMEVEITLDDVIVDSESGYGGIEISNGNLNLTGGTIQNITEYTNGGALLAKNGANVTLDNVTIQNNEADYGGAISLSEEASVSMYKVILKQNSAASGGGIDISDKAHLFMEGVTFAENKAAQSGGGLFIGDKTVAVTGKDNKFYDNEAEIHGGGIGLAILGKDGEELLKTIKLDTNDWRGNQSGQQVDVITAEQVGLYTEIGDITAQGNVWNGQKVSYLYNIYTVTYDMQDVPGGRVEENDSSLRFGEGYTLALPGEDKVAFENTNGPWGYRSLSGWTEDRYGNNSGVNRLTFSGDIADITLYPVWDHETAMVTFYPGEKGEFIMPVAEMIEELKEQYPGYNIVNNNNLPAVIVEKGTAFLPPDSVYLKNSAAEQYFQYWLDESNKKYNFTDPVTTDIMLTAVWGAIPTDKALLVFHSDGGTYVEAIEVNEGATALASTHLDSVEGVSKTGHKFVRWYTFEDTGSTNAWNPSDFGPVEGGKQYDIYAGWKVEEYKLTVTTDLVNGGCVKVSEDGKQIAYDPNEPGFYSGLAYGSQMNLEAFSKDGYYFTGWTMRVGDSTAAPHMAYLSEKLDFTMTDDTIVTAHFEKKIHEVGFYEKGGRLLLTKAVTHGDTVSRDAVPDAPIGYTQEWYDSNGEKETFETSVTVNKPLKFERELEKETYTVRFYRSDGENEEFLFEEKVKFDEAIGNLDETREITRDYYAFAGWSTSAELRLPWNLDTDTVQHDMNLYTIWDTVNAPEPVVTKVESSIGKTLEFDNPDPIEVNAGLVSFFVEAKAAVADPAGHDERNVLTYRWVLCDADGNEQRVMSDSELVQYVANFVTAGDVYCYLEVTNTNEYYSGKTSATVKSEVIKITVKARPPQAAIPIIVEHPDNLTVEMGEDAEFKVSATSADIDSSMADGYKAELSYQWYELKENEQGETEAVKIEGAVDPEYSFVTEEVGTFYYYAEVTNTVSDDNDYESSETIISNTARLKVNNKQPDTYNVSYNKGDAQDGKPPVDNNDYKAGDLVTALDNTGGLKKANHTFIGWTQDKGGHGLTLKPGKTYEMPAENVELYPVWEKDAETYSVTYHNGDADSGEPPRDTNRYEAGAQVTALENTGGLEKENYTFIGWTQDKDGHGLILKPGKEYEMPAENVNLYPAWEKDAEPDVYNVTYHKGDAEDGEAPVDNNKYEAGGEVTVLDNTGDLKKVDHTFIGWTQNPAGGGLVMNPAKTFAMPEEDVDLYPVWEKNAETYTVTYHDDGADTGEPPEDNNKYQAGDEVIVFDNDGNLVKADHTFIGWTQNPQGGGLVIRPGKTYEMPAEDVDVYPVWEKNAETYTVTYHGDGAETGEPPEDNNEYQAGEKVTALGNNGNLAKTGYTFIGWSLDKDGHSVILKPGSTYEMPAEDVDVYPAWDKAEDPHPVIYTVTYDKGEDAESGEPPVDSNEYKTGAEVTVLDNTGDLKRAGYTFIGWTQNPGRGLVMNPGSEFLMPAENVVLYPVWEKNAETYTVTYHASGADTGEPPEDINKYKAGDEVTALDNIKNLEKANHTFIGWSQDSEGHGMILKPGKTYEMPAENVNLYPVWEQNAVTYTVNYNKGDAEAGEPPKDENKYEAGTQVTALENTGGLEKAGYIFIGWAQDPEGHGVILRPGRTYEMPAEGVNLYPAWEQDSAIYKVTYHKGDAETGKQPEDFNKYKAGDEVTILGNPGDLKKAGYTFIGWTQSPTGGGLVMKPLRTFLMPAEDVDLYPVWEKDAETYTVTYHGDGADEGVPPVDINRYKAGDEVTALDNIGELKKAGYTFNGWTQSPTGNGLAIRPGSTYEMPAENVDVYPVWKKDADPVQDVYTVTYHKGDAETGEPPVDAHEYEAGDEVTVLGNDGNLEKTDHTFIGWTQDPEGNGVISQPGEKLRMAESDIDLYPAWEKNTTPAPAVYNVSYHKGDAEGGEPPTDTNAYQAGGKVTVLGNDGNLEKADHTFIGWTQKSDGSGTALVPGSAFLMPTGDVDLYPVWIKNTVPDTYNVIYSAGGASSGYPPADTNDYNAGDTVTVLGNTGKLSKTGYTFSGWLTDPDDKDTLLKPGDEFTMPNGDVLLTAAWDKAKTNLSKPGNKSTTKPTAKKTGSAKTGDDLMNQPILLLLLAGTVMSVLFIWKRRREMKS